MKLILILLSVTVIFSPIKCKAADEIPLVKIIEDATKGDPSSQILMGMAYEQGDGIEQDFQKAYEWYLKGAEQGHSGNQLMLANLLLSDRLGPPDYTAGLKWATKAAESGNSMAQTMAQNLLGNLYYNGNAVEQDYKKAYYWWEKAANGTDLKIQAEAQYRIANLYREGKGVDKNYNTALEWYKKAAAHGYLDTANEQQEIMKIIGTDPQDEASIQTAALMGELHRMSGYYDEYILCVKTWAERFQKSSTDAALIAQGALGKCTTERASFYSQANATMGRENAEVAVQQKDEELQRYVIGMVLESRIE